MSQSCAIASIELADANHYYYYYYFFFEDADPQMVREIGAFVSGWPQQLCESKRDLARGGEPGGASIKARRHPTWVVSVAAAPVMPSAFTNSPELSAIQPGGPLVFIILLLALLSPILLR